MEIKIAVLADAANVSSEGKLNITGIFNRLNASAFPVRWPSMTLVVRFEAHGNEVGDHNLAVRIVDEDGSELARIEGMLHLGEPDDPGLPIIAQLISGIQDAVFAHPGTYAFDILIDGRYLGSTPLHVVQRV